MKTEMVEKKNIGNSPSDMIRQAIDGGADLEKLEKLLVLKERYDANEARKTFAVAFSIVQSKISSIVKTKLNPQTHSKYATLDNILEIAKPIYTTEGFSMIFYEGDTTVSENIRVCADVLHKDGHKETYHIDIPCDGVGIKGNAFMTKTHTKASSTAYGRRYLTCMVWNIATSDDSDGNGVAEKISAEEVKDITAQLASVDAPLKAFLEYMKLEKLEDMVKSDMKKALNTIEAKRTAKK